jgi:uncharacterized protein DUF2393
MPEPTNISSGKTDSGNPLGKDPLFKEPSQEKSFPTAAVAVAAVVVVIAIVAMLVMGRHGSGAGNGAAYAANLELTNLQPSQSESLSGGRSTYLDGHIVNHGNQTVTAVTVEAAFGVDGGQPQTQTAPVSVIRTREPYVDTQPLSAAPLAPGASADFRLIFEGVGDNWDQKPPTVGVVQVSTK